MSIYEEYVRAVQKVLSLRMGKEKSEAMEEADIISCALKNNNPVLKNYTRGELYSYCIKNM